MKQTINFYDFERAFADMDRKENFSYEGLKLLFDYLEDYEESTGEEIELDVIAICCDYTEDDIETIINEYSIKIEEDENPEEVVENYLSENTTLIGKTSIGTFVYQVF
jgi:hypothetical protein